MAAFWDTSAIVPLCVAAQRAPRTRKLLESYPQAVWWGAIVEAHSAIERLRHSRDIGEPGYLVSRQRLELLAARWRVVLPTDVVQSLACDLLEQFPLRAADALQLAAALVWCGKHPRGRLFICNDQRLSAAASARGFDVREL